MTRRRPRTAMLAAALAADVLLAASLIAASLAGATARSLAATLTAFGVLSGLLALALTADARLRERRDGPQQPGDPDPFPPGGEGGGFLPEQYRDRDHDGI